MSLFWYVQASSLSNPEVIIKFDETVAETVGKDYYSCTGGDKFGNSTHSLITDISYSGFDDGQCSVVTGSSYVKIAYSREVYTYDEFDLDIYVDPTICIIVGSTEQCVEMTL